MKKITYDIIIFIIILSAIAMATHEIVGNIFSQNLLINNGTTINLTYPIIQGFNATVKNQTWLEFDGVDDRVQIADNLDYNNSFTISFWINKPNDAVSPAERYACKLSSTSNQRSWELHANHGNDTWFVIYHNGNSSNTTTSQMNNLIKPNTWYHIIARWDGNATSLYLNGIRKDADTATQGKLVYTSSTNVTLGNCQSNFGFYNGSIDEFKIYNYSLSDVEIADIYFQRRNGIINGSFLVEFYDNFSSYTIGNNTTPPTWIPQYVDRVNITSDNRLLIDSYLEKGGDRDVHVTLNKSSFPSEADSVSIEMEYNVTDSNCSETSTPSTAIYVHYNATAFGGSATSFISGEWKINKTSATTCGNGIAQLSTFKRINATSYTLCSGSCPTFYVEFNKTYIAKLIFTKINDSNYNASFYLNGTLMVSSFNVSTTEIFNGENLIESVYSKAYFTYVNINRTGVINNSNLYYRFNENQGSISYDIFGNINGSLNIPIYRTDGINNTLINGTDYQLNVNQFKLINSLYSWTLINVSYENNTRLTHTTPSTIVQNIRRNSEFIVNDTNITENKTIAPIIKKEKNEFLVFLNEAFNNPENQLLSVIIIFIIIGIITVALYSITSKN